ncbi:YlmC/YmxH family sporulation protein [Clostridium sp. DL1XJH146]
MEDYIKYYSDIERYEIININDGEKYNFLMNNDIIVDEDGSFKFLIIGETKTSFSFFKNNTYIELPWENIKKIGSSTIIVDFDKNDAKQFTKKE